MYTPQIDGRHAFRIGVNVRPTSEGVGNVHSWSFTTIWPARAMSAIHPIATEQRIHPVKAALRM